MALLILKRKQISANICPLALKQFLLYLGIRKKQSHLPNSALRQYEAFIIISIMAHLFLICFSYVMPFLHYLFVFKSGFRFLFQALEVPFAYSPKSWRYIYVPGTYIYVQRVHCTLCTSSPRQLIVWLVGCSFQINFSSHRCNHSQANFCKRWHSAIYWQLISTQQS